MQADIQSTLYIKERERYLKINLKDQTDAASDEALNFSLELETSEKFNWNSDRKESVRIYKTFDLKYTNPRYEDSSKCKNNERVCKSLIKKLLHLTVTESVKSLFLPKLILVGEDLVKQAEAIANVDSNLNLDYMLSSYKPMPNEKSHYQWRPGKL